ncbi:MAG: hypothetical protein KGH71_01985 [Candidatus Micrarchaeota archaeon]|nr:hypothetical protein [Candidatus Micrarchaeota archaeon]
MSLNLKNSKVLASEAQCEHACSNLENARPHALDRTTFYSMVKIMSDGEVVVTPKSASPNDTKLAERVVLEIKTVVEHDALTAKLLSDHIVRSLPSPLGTELEKNRTELSEIHSKLLETDNFLSFVGEKLSAMIHN